MTLNSGSGARNADDFEKVDPEVARRARRDTDYPDPDDED